MFAQILVISIILLALAFTGIAIKILAKKDGEFKKSCGSTDPATGQKIGCVCGEGSGDRKCENKSKVKFQTIEID